MRLANSVGIIDFGYRGSLKVAIDNRGDVPYEIKSGERFFQLCLPNLVPFDIRFGKVSLNTERGEGGFGSTNSPSVTATAVARQLTGSSTDGEIESFKN
jgi:dUTP pyrophosphatase